MSAPSIYAAINAVSAEFAKTGIAKDHVNHADDYRYRSVDDLLDRLAPLLAHHRLCVLPRVIERVLIDRRDEAEHLLFHTSLRVSFTLASVDDGSMHIVEAFGEALDASDKSTAKAMSAAYKSAMIQTFCIPLSGSEDPDRTSPRASSRGHIAEPLQGWEQWTRDLRDIVGVCESTDAIDLVQDRNRELLTALSRERRELYAELGQSFSERRQMLLDRARTPPSKAKYGRRATVSKRILENANG